MPGLNEVRLIGYVGNDAELRYTQSGTSVCNFKLATTEKWTSKNGERQERTEWHRIVAWKNLADICAQYVKKGGQVFVAGRLQTREWEDREGQKRTTTEVVASNVLVLGKSDGHRPEQSSEDQSAQEAGQEGVPF